MLQQLTSLTRPACRSLVALIVCFAAASCGKAEEPTTAQKLDAIFEAPKGWHEAENKAIELYRDGQYEQAFAIHDEWVKKHPKFPDAHFSAAESHAVRAIQLNHDPAQRPARLEHLQAAAEHYRHYRSLQADPADREIGTTRLAQVLSADGLNELGEAEQVARELVQELPDHPRSWGLLAQILREAGKHDEAGSVLATSQPQIAADKQLDYAELLLEHVDGTPQMGAADVQAFLGRARQIIDAAVASNARDFTAIRLKSDALKIESERVEQDPARREALFAESERLRKEAETLLDAAMKS